MANRQYQVPIEITPGSGGGGGSGTVTQVNTAGIATGGPITTTGTVTVAGSGNTTTAATAAASVHSAPAGDVVTTDGSGNVQDSGTLLSSLAPLASPTFTGTPAAPTASGGTNTTQLATTAFVQAAIGASGAVVWNNIGNATGNLALANGANTTTFNQTSNVAWLWANTTTATSGTTNASPLLELAANYWTGAASAADTWTISSALAAGTNGASTLTIGHSGSTFVQPTVALPYVSTSGTITTAAGNALQLGGGTQLNLTPSSTTQTIRAFQQGASLVFQGNLTTTAGFQHTLQDVTNAQSATSGISGLVTISPASGGSGWAPTSGAGTYQILQVQQTINQTSTASGSYTGIMLNVKETALLGSSNNLLDLQAGSSGTTSKFTITNGGMVSTYNGTATVRGGIPSEIAQINLTAQGAAIANGTALYAVPAGGAGLYRVNVYSKITTASGTSSTLGGVGGFTLTWTDPTDSTTPTAVTFSDQSSQSLTGNTTTTVYVTSAIVSCKASTNLQYGFGYTDGTAAMRYKLSIIVEYLG